MLERGDQTTRPLRCTGFQRQRIAQQTYCTICIGKELKRDLCDLRLRLVPLPPSIDRPSPSNQSANHQEPPGKTAYSSPSHLILRRGFPPLSYVNFSSASFSGQLPACHARLQTQMQLQHQTRCQGYLVSFFPRHSSHSFPPKPAAPSRLVLETLPLELTV